MPSSKVTPPGGRHGGDEAVFLERWPVLGTDQIEAHAAQPRRFTATVFERHLGIERESRNTLLQASRLRGVVPVCAVVPAVAAPTRAAAVTNSLRRMAGIVLTVAAERSGQVHCRRAARRYPGRNHGQQNQKGRLHSRATKDREARGGTPSSSSTLENARARIETGRQVPGP